MALKLWYVASEYSSTIKIVQIMTLGDLEPFLRQGQIWENART